MLRKVKAACRGMCLRVGLTLVTLACASSATTPFDHSTWTRLLQRYVDDEGRVAYRDLAANDLAALDSYVASLAAARTDGWARADRIAFWLNAYNAVIVRAILEGYSAESTLSRYSLFYRHKQDIAGSARTPNDIEHRILRPSGDSRIHFALVCASSSCPKLRRQAWIGETLDRDLDEEARRFITEPRRNRISPDAATIHLSKIFEWYRDDFGGTDESVRTFIGRYTGEPERRYLHERQPTIEYLDYDWTMNAQPGQRPIDD